MEYLSQFMEYLKIESWIIQVFLVVFFTMLLNYMLKRTLGKVYSTFVHSQTFWDHALVESMQRPLLLVIWVVGLTLAADIAGKQTDSELFTIVPVIRQVGVIFCITWFLIRFTKTGENLYGQDP